MKALVRLAATYFIVIGLASLLAPQAASGQLGHSLTPFDVFVARSLGAAIVALGMMNWTIASRLHSPMRGLLGANIFVNASLAVIDIVAVHQGVIGKSSWFGICMHGLLCVLFAYCLIRNGSVKESKE